MFYGFRRWLSGFRRGRTHLFMVPSLVVFVVSGCYRTAAVSPMETVNIKNIRTFQRRTKYLCIYIYIYIYVYIYIYTYRLLRRSVFFTDTGIRLHYQTTPDHASEEASIVLV